MKRFPLLLVSAVILLAGCAREAAIEGGAEAVEQVVSFTVGLPELTTKAQEDNDGNAAKANHWIMEVRDAQGALFYKDVKTPAAGTLSQTFKVALIKDQPYNILFWADNNGGFYDTADLTNVTFKDNALTYAGNKDARDAFTACKAYTATVGETVSVKLYRPFAQLNIVTTDLGTLWAQAQTTTNPAQTYLKFEPKEYKAVVKVPASFNVLTQQCGEATSDVTVTAAETYYGYTADGTVQTNNNYQLHTDPATLFMDYLFASKNQKDIVSIAFTFVSNGLSVVYPFESIPLQANYRTNIKGKLLSNETDCVVEIKPAWSVPPIQ